MKPKELDLKDIWDWLWHQKKALFLVLIVSISLGLGISFLIPKSYTASTIFISQSSKSSGGNSLGGLAALAGVNLGSLNNDSGIPPSLFPKIVSSIPFMMKILYTSVPLNDSLVSYREYLIYSRFESLKPNLDDKKLLKNEISTRAILELSHIDFELTEYLKTVMFLESNTKDGYIHLSVTDYRPEVAAIIAESAEKELQSRIIDFKVEEARQFYEFTLEQLNNKKREFYEIQDSLARFNDGNQVLTSSLSRNRLSRLQSQNDLLNSVYVELSTQLEQAALQVKKNTPVFTIIQPVYIPKVKSGPNRVQYIIIYAFLGLMMFTFYSLLRAFLQERSED